MRHKKHRHILGVKKEHRSALLSNLASSLIIHGRIKTTLAKAKALRPFAEKLITLAKRAKTASSAAESLHLRRQAIARLRNPEAVKVLFNEKVDEFLNRSGGYTRIYKVGPRIGDAAEMGLIELIAASDEGYTKKARSSKEAQPVLEEVSDSSEPAESAEVSAEKNAD
jgi:large subunit ribosomal protein L17